MAEVKEIKILNLNNKAYVVEDCSQEVRGLMDLYNKANRKDFDLREEVTLLIAAKEQLLRQVQVLLAQQEAAEQAAAQPAPVAPVAPVAPAANADSDEEADTTAPTLN